MFVKSTAIKEQTKAYNYSMFSVIKVMFQIPFYFPVFKGTHLSEMKASRLKSTSLISAATRAFFSPESLREIVPSL